MKTTEPPGGLPEKNKACSSMEAAPEAKRVRAFHLSDFKSESKLPMLSGRTGARVSVTLKDMNNYQKEIVARAIDFILGKLKGSAYEEPIQKVMVTAKYFVTVSRHVYAHCEHCDDGALIIFNSKLIAGPFGEVAVSVLHELLHRVIISDDRNPMSLEEARHDLLCYRLLGLPVRRDHWSFEAYPWLRDECFRTTETCDVEAV